MRILNSLASRDTRWLPRAVPSHQLIPVGFPSVGILIFPTSRAIRWLPQAPSAIPSLPAVRPVIPGPSPPGY